MTDTQLRDELAIAFDERLGGEGDTFSYKAGWDAAQKVMGQEIERLKAENTDLHLDIDKFESAICMDCDLWKQMAGKMAEALYFYFKNGTVGFGAIERALKEFEEMG